MTTDTKSKYPLVIVRWQDILSCAGWESKDEVDPIEVESCGWLCHDGDDVIKIGSTLGNDNECYGITAYPRGCVLEIIPVRRESAAVHKAVQQTPSSPHRSGSTSRYPQALP